MEIPLSELSWLKQFFAPPNLMLWEDTKYQVPLRDEFEAWLKIVLEGRGSAPVLLPRLSKRRLRWYACSDSEQSSAQVGEELHSLVAHAYALVDTHPQLDSDDECESSLLKRFGNNVCTVDIDEGMEEKVLNLLGVYRNLVMRRPVRAKVGVRPSGRIRSEFDKALLARNFEEARKYIEELKNTGRLDLQNQLFLEIRLLAEQGKWLEIVVNPNYLKNVSDLALPAKILSDLVEAVYQTELINFEKNSDPSGAIKFFKDYVRPKFPRLFLSRKGVKSPSVLKVFLINEICENSPEYSVCSKLVQEFPPDLPGYSYIKSLFDFVVKKPVIEDTFTRANNAFDEDRYETALELYFTCASSSEILKKIIRCVPWIDASEELEKTWIYCQSCPSDWITDLPPRFVKTYDELKKRFSSKPIRGWCDWAEFVLQDGDRKKAAEILQRGLLEWSITDYLTGNGEIEAFCDLLTQGMDSDPLYFQRHFPDIYEFFSLGESPSIYLRPLYCELLQLLALSDSVSETDLVLSQELVQSLLEVGVVPAKIYADMMAAVEELWANAKSKKHLDWALDMAELLAINPSPTPQLALNFFLSVVEVVAANRHRVDETVWMILDALGRDYNATEYVEKVRPAKEAVKASFAAKNALEGKKIGIYSLTEQAALRAKSYLESIFLNVTVEVNHDHEATQALINLAKSSDLFVFAWRSSKHQAYFCVKNHIDEKRLLMPTGKGSTSIVNCLLEKVMVQY